MEGTMPITQGSNDDYPPDDEARPPVPFPPATALPCERVPRARVLFPGAVPGEGDDVVTLAVVVVGPDAVPTIVPAEGGSDGLVAPPPHLQGRGGGERAYALTASLQKAIFGEVWKAEGVRRLPPPPASAGGGERCPAEWVVTGETFAVKEMSWRTISRLRGRMTEDPINEIQAMQFFRRWYEDRRRRHLLPPSPAAATGGQDEAAAETAHGEIVRIMTETNVMLPVDVLTDQQYLYPCLYSVTPFCDGGELNSTVFTEDEARTFMKDALNGLESLQAAGLAHRDISVENLLMHKGSCVVIDMGQCVRVPRTQERRYLIRWDGVFGKPRHPYYLPPEAMVLQNYDGFAVDLWAVFITLAYLLTGTFPWEAAQLTNCLFDFGCVQECLREMLEDWQVHLTDEAFDLLQKCSRCNLKDRLSLKQISAHPWMNLPTPRQPAPPNFPHASVADEREPMEM